MNRTGTVAAAVAGWLAAGSACAHHSFAEFDRGKSVTVTGTVRALQWQNPHVWLWVNTVGAGGAVVPFGFEGGAPAESAREGFDRHSVHPGDKISVTYAPLRDGRNGGSYTSLTLADGRVLKLGGNGGAGGPPPGS